MYGFDGKILRQHEPPSSATTLFYIATYGLMGHPEGNLFTLYDGQQLLHYKKTPVQIQDCTSPARCKILSNLQVSNTVSFITHSRDGCSAAWGFCKQSTAYAEYTL